MQRVLPVSVLHGKHTYCPSQNLSVNASQRNSPRLAYPFSCVRTPCHWVLDFRFARLELCLEKPGTNYPATQFRIPEEWLP